MAANGGSALPAALKNALADAAIANHAGRMLAYRVGFMQSQGKIPNQEASASKLIGTEIAQRISQVGMRIMGLAGQVHRGSKYAVLDGWPTGEYVNDVSFTLRGGTSEVQRNIVATRGLGLPRGWSRSGAWRNDEETVAAARGVSEKKETVWTDGSTREHSW